MSTPRPLIESYPLQWPALQPRTPHDSRRKAAFQVGFAIARDDLLEELKLLGANDVILSSNVALRRDGLPYASAPEPLDPGVALYFERWAEGGAPRRVQYVIACDSYSLVKWNVRAVGATVQALRTIQRHGATSLMERAFLGFAALPPAPTSRTWRDVLGFGASSSPILAEVRARYRELTREHHPDVGGDAARMAELNRAMADFEASVTRAASQDGGAS